MGGFASFLEPVITESVARAHRPNLPVITIESTLAWAVALRVSQKEYAL